MTRKALQNRIQNSNSKYHVKSYKAKKFWVFAGLTALFLGGAAASNTHSVHADELGQNSNSSQSNNNQGSQASVISANTPHQSQNSSNAPEIQAQNTPNSLSHNSQSVSQNNNNNNNQSVSQNNNQNRGAQHQLNANSTTANYNYKDFGSNQAISSSNNNVVNKNSDIRSNDLKLPNNYRLANVGNDNDPRTASDDYVPNMHIGNSPKSFSVPLVSHDITDYGYWGTSRYTLDTAGNLTLNDGVLDNSSHNGLVGSNIGLDPGKVHGVKFNKAELPNDSSNLFSNLPNLQKVDTTSAKTDHLYNINGMFKDDPKLTSVNGNGIDTSNVSDMGSVFANDPNLRNANLNTWNTSNVANLANAFSGDSNLNNLNLSNWNTSNANDMNHIFSNDTNLNSVNIGNFDTTHVNNENGMFNNDHKLYNISIGNNTKLLNADNNGTPGVTGHWQRNSNSNSAADLNNDNNPTAGTYHNVSLVNFRPVNYYFGDSLIGNGSVAVAKNNPSDFAIDDDFDNLPNGYGFDPDNNRIIVNPEGTSYVNLDKSGKWGTATWDADTNGNILVHDGTLDSINGSGNNSALTNATGINSNDIKSVAFRNTNTSASDASNMLSNLPNITSIDASGLNTNGITNSASMFANDPSLNTLNIRGLDTSNVSDFSNMFANDPALYSLDVSGLNLSNANNTENMFANDSGLTDLNTHNFDTPNLNNSHGMFSGDTSIHSLDLSNFDTHEDSDESEMFRAVPLTGLTLGDNANVLGDTSDLENDPSADKGFVSLSGSDNGKTITNGQLVPNNTWYAAGHAAPIYINYINQNGKKIAIATIDTSAPESIADVSKVKNATVPAGYTLNPNQDVHAISGADTLTKNLKVTGNKVSYNTTIKEAKNGNVTNTIPVTLVGLVGDNTSIDLSQVPVPQGYQLDMIDSKGLDKNHEITANLTPNGYNWVEGLTPVIDFASVDNLPHKSNNNNSQPNNTANPQPNTNTSRNRKPNSVNPQQQNNSNNIAKNRQLVNNLINNNRNSNNAKPNNNTTANNKPNSNNAKPQQPQHKANNKPAPKVVNNKQTKQNKIHTYHNVNHIPVNGKGLYNGEAIIRRGINKTDYPEFVRATHKIYLHTDPVFKKGKRVAYLMPTAKGADHIRVRRAFSLQGKNGRIKTRYEVRVHHHDFFITGNPKRVRDAYTSERRLARHHTMFIRLNKDERSYMSRHFNYDTESKRYHKGDLLQIRRIVHVGHGHERYTHTRFELMNGRYVSSRPRRFHFVHHVHHLEKSNSIRKAHQSLRRSSRHGHVVQIVHKHGIKINGIKRAKGLRRGQYLRVKGISKYGHKYALKLQHGEFLTVGRHSVKFLK